MSWAPEVVADSTGKWCGNQLRFATQAEADLNVYNLAMRWTSVVEFRSVESTDPVNARWDEAKGTILLAARDVEPGKSWAFPEHRTAAEACGADQEAPPA